MRKLRSEPTPPRRLDVYDVLVWTFVTVAAAAFIYALCAVAWVVS